MGLAQRARQTSEMPAPAAPTTNTMIPASLFKAEMSKENRSLLLAKLAAFQPPARANGGFDS